MIEKLNSARAGWQVSFPKIQSRGIRAVRQNQRIIRCDVCDHPPACNVADLFKSRRRLEVENLFLRHQLNVALR
jgi:hypothetical protein